MAGGKSSEKKRSTSGRLWQVLRRNASRKGGGGGDEGFDGGGGGDEAKSVPLRDVSDVRVRDEPSSPRSPRSPGGAAKVACQVLVADAPGAPPLVLELEAPARRLGRTAEARVLPRARLPRTPTPAPPPPVVEAPEVEAPAPGRAPRGPLLRRRHGDGQRRGASFLSDVFLPEGDEPAAAPLFLPHAARAVEAPADDGLDDLDAFARARERETSQQTGWLLKRGAGTSALGRKTWKRRFFQLSTEPTPSLRYYSDDVAKAANLVGSWDLSGFSRVAPRGDDGHFDLDLSSRAWLGALEAAIGQSQAAMPAVEGDAPSEAGGAAAAAAVAAVGRVVVAAERGAGAAAGAGAGARAGVARADAGGAGGAALGLLDLANFARAEAVAATDAQGLALERAPRAPEQTAPRAAEQTAPRAHEQAAPRAAEAPEPPPRPAAAGRQRRSRRPRASPRACSTRSAGPRAANGDETWRLRWHEFDGAVLRWREPDEAEWLGAIRVGSDRSARRVDEAPLGFGLRVTSPDLSMTLYATTKADRKAWLAALDPRSGAQARAPARAAAPAMAMIAQRSDGGGGALALGDQNLPYVVFETSVGDFVVELYFQHAPATCKNFRELSATGYYDGRSSTG
ncbi:hypothetical protein JL720_3202 [Aureococcus anophagefferens]|nr:hypothetical protein JL720_3202 [Aureococcus anophagefferens]